MRVSAQERGDEEACVLVVEVAFWSRVWRFIVCCRTEQCQAEERESGL